MMTSKLIIILLSMTAIAVAVPEFRLLYPKENQEFAVFIGNIEDAANTQILVSNGITSVLSIVQNSEIKQFPKNLI